MNRRGQSLVVTATMLLLLVLMVFFTFTVGERVRQKTSAQAAADAAAWSTAVAEARALNFYAFSNRAMVSHTVSVLSLMSYQSYLSWYEDALTANWQNYRNISLSLGGQCRAPTPSCAPCRPRACDASRRAADIASLYAFAMPERNGRILDSNPFLAASTGGSVWVERGGTPVRVPANNGPVVPPYSRLGERCVGDRECTVEAQGPRGAQWFHDQYHMKSDGNWCGLLNDAVRDELSKVQLLRAHQLDVHDELLALLGGTPSHEIDFPEARRRLPRSGERIIGADGDEGGSPELLDFTDDDLHPSIAAQKSLPQQLVSRFDARLEVTPQSLTLSRKAWERAVFDQRRPDFAHRDLDLVLYSTRYPGWLVHRTNGLVADMNWARLARLARVLAGGDSTQTFVVQRGNASAVGGSGLAKTEGVARELPWMGNPAFFAPPSASSSGVKLARLIHASDEVPVMMSLGAEDHGYVAAQYQLGGCACEAASTIVQDVGRDGLFNSGIDGDTTLGDDSGGVHFFHAYGMAVPSHAIGAGRQLPLVDYGALGHMRFVPSDTDPLWNMPRVTVLVSRPPRTSPRPWDFDFEGGFANGGGFTTTKSEGDLAAGNVMAAAAGALVYYHHPDEGPGAGAKEPPNLWNPFWRAKLHPLRVRDLAAAGHRPTTRLLKEVPGDAMAP